MNDTPADLQQLADHVEMQIQTLSDEQKAEVDRILTSIYERNVWPADLLERVEQTYQPVNTIPLAVLADMVIGYVTSPR